MVSSRPPLLVSKNSRDAMNDESTQQEEFTLRAALWPREISPVLGEKQGDEHAALGLSIGTLKRLRLQVGACVIIRSTAAEEGSRYALIAAVQSEPPLEDDVAFLTPLLAFNMRLSLLLKPFMLNDRARATPVGPTVTFARSEPSSASNVSVCLVREPANAGELLGGIPPPDMTDSLEDALHKYFATQRLLSPGDVFCARAECADDPSDDAGLDRSADASSDTGESHREGSAGGSRPGGRLVYFKVVDLRPGAGWVTRSCRMMLDGTRAAALPSKEVLMQYAPLAQACRPQGPLGPTPRPFRPKLFQELCSIIAPVVHPRGAPLSLRPAILVTGPVGAGKRLCAVSVAQSLGIHVVQYSCHELVAASGRSDAKLGAALTAAFESAAEYTPALLVLRRFGALAGQSATGARPTRCCRIILSADMSCLMRAGGVRVSSLSPLLPYLGAPQDAGAAAPGGSHFSALGRALESCVRKFSLHRPPRGAVQAVETAEGLSMVVDSDDEIDAEHFAGGEDVDGHGQGHDDPDSKAPPSLMPEQRKTWRRKSPGRKGPGPVVLLALAESTEGISPELRRCFTHELEHEPPDEEERRLLLEGALGNAAQGLDLSQAAAASAGLVHRDLRAVAADVGVAAAARHERLRDKAGNDAGAVDFPIVEVQADLDRALRRAGLRVAAAVGAPEIPTVKWDDVGGLEDAKRIIIETIELPLRHRALFTKGGHKRSGALLYGPPGTGKTLLAKAVATECGLRFLGVKGPELINMYIGESEKNIREVFIRARRAQPCVVFFDELDSLAPMRGSGGDSGGVMDRVVSQLLAEVDSLAGAGKDDVFVIGATNRPDLLDPALLRPGRFDQLVYVGVQNSHERDADSNHPQATCNVLKALTRKFNLGSDADLAEVARRAPKRYTGADFYALCSDAWMRAAKRSIEERTGHEVTVHADDFFCAIENLQPSLSEEELQRYAALQQGLRNSSV